MSNRQIHILASFAALAALLQGWVVEELFYHPGNGLKIIVGISINVAGLLLAYATVLKLLGERWALLSLRVFVYAAFFAALLRAVPNAGGWPLVLFVLAVALAVKFSGDTSRRLLYATAVASVAFVAAPLVRVHFGAENLTWLSASLAKLGDRPAPRKGAVVVLLLDEMGYQAASPFAADFRAAGLNVQYIPIAPVGQNTANVIPATLTGQDFSQSRPCSGTAQCSGSNILDYSRVRVGRDNVDVAGSVFPYCKIKGLRSCHDNPWPNERQLTYLRLLRVYTRAFNISAPNYLKNPTLNVLRGPSERRLLNDAQEKFIMSAPVWEKGGILFAHILLPHPPGLDGTTTLDADYSGNLSEARRLVSQLKGRLEAEFGDHYSIVIFSDHPLRSVWSEKTYTKNDSRVRPEFLDNEVPLIVASPSAPSTTRIGSNREIFRVVEAEATRILD